MWLVAQLFRDSPNLGNRLIAHPFGFEWVEGSGGRGEVDPGGLGHGLQSDSARLRLTGHWIYRTIGFELGPVPAQSLLTVEEGITQTGEFALDILSMSSYDCAIDWPAVCCDRQNNQGRSDWATGKLLSG